MGSQESIKSLPGQFTGTGNSLTHYMSWGSGEKILLVLHKVTGGAETWLPVLDRFASKYRIIAPDLLGHGYSAKSDQGYSLNDYCRQLVVFIEELHLDPVLLMGHSLGARVALAFANAFPEKVSRLVCVEPPLSGPGKAPYPYDLASVLDWQNRVQIEGTAYCMKTNPNYTLEEAELRARYGCLCEKQVLEDAWQGFEEQSMDAFAREIRCPTLLLYGENGVITEAQAAEFSSQNEKITVTRLSGCSHNPPWENGDLFFRHASSFLDAVSVSPKEP